MREHPILFSTDMVQANLAGRKTMTRRVVKQNDFQREFYDTPEKIANICPYGKAGDLLWVRETFKRVGFDASESPMMMIEYGNGDVMAFNVPKEHELSMQNKWKPSIHMPKAYARIWLHVKCVRVERLHDISEADAIAEGILPQKWYDEHKDEYLDYYENYLPVGYTALPAIDSFKSLWRSINGEENWNTNPWVWVIEYNILSKTGRYGIPADILQQPDGKEETV